MVDNEAEIGAAPQEHPPKEVGGPEEPAEATLDSPPGASGTSPARTVISALKTHFGLLTSRV